MIPTIVQQLSAAACMSDETPAAIRRASGAADLLDLIARSGSIRTAALVEKTGLTSNQVWGMLKHHRNSGRVQFATGMWSLTENFKGRDVNRSVRVLRAMGYTVLAPGQVSK